MNAPLETIPSIDTARSEASRARILAILEQLEAMGRRLAAHSAPTAERSDAPAASDPAGVAAVAEQHASAWAEAVHMGEVRARRKAQGLDVSVRAIATEVGCSRSHAGDCLKIRDAFNDTLLHFIGESDSQDDGHARLARLSFRTLRSLARLHTGLARVREARRLTSTA